MAQHAAESSKTIRKLIESVECGIDQASAELQGRAATDGREVNASRTEVNQMLDSLADLNEQMRQTISASRLNSESLARDISQAVTMLQFQDTVGQRIAHVVQSLREIHTSFARHLENVGEPPAGESKRLTSGRDWQADMARHYTMESERKVLAGAATGSSKQAVNEGNNVELF
jgi:hypothetical protein